MGNVICNFLQKIREILLKCKKNREIFAEK